MNTSNTIELLWQNLIWPGLVNGLPVPDAELRFFESLPLASQLYVYWHQAPLPTGAFNWLIAQAESSELALWQHLLGFCVWHSADQIPLDLNSLARRHHFRMPKLFISSVSNLIRHSADYQTLHALDDVDYTLWQTTLNQSYLRWDHLIKRRSMAPADRAFCFIGWHIPLTLTKVRISVCVNSQNVCGWC